VATLETLAPFPQPLQSTDAVEGDGQSPAEAADEEEAELVEDADMMAWCLELPGKLSDPDPHVRATTVDSMLALMGERSFRVFAADDDWVARPLSELAD
jgi:hypothetical protein